jgi:hypothetical protein
MGRPVSAAESRNVLAESVGTHIGRLLAVEQHHIAGAPATGRLV